MINPASNRSSRWPHGASLLLLLLVAMTVVGELHLSNSVLPDTTANISAQRRMILIAWAAAWFLALTGVVLAVTGRLLSSLAAANLVALGIFVLSSTKFEYLNAKLLYPDLYFSLRDASEVEFLISHYPQTIVGAAVFLGGSVLILGAIWRREKARRRSRTLGLVLSIASIGAITAVDAYVLPRGLKENVFWRAVRDERFFSDFFMSWQFFSTLIGTPLALPVADSVDPALDDAIADMPANGSYSADRKPHILAILHESSIDPAIYFDGPQFDVRESFFASGDGARRRLIVNTFGGNTWMSEHGLALGVDVDFFAGLGPFLALVGIGEFTNTFAEALKANGYEVVANYISPLSFQNTERFYRSIGFDKVLGPDELEPFTAGQNPPRDRAYYAFALDQLEAAIEEDPHEPTFHLIWTIATHYPYRTPIFVEVRSNEIAGGNEAAEFARRQRIAADDLAWFEAELARRFPDQSFMIAGFGDHLPKITDGYFKGHEGGFRKRGESESKYLTYYRIAGINFDPDYSQLSETASIGYLGEMILGAAKLSAPPSFLIRRWLRERCSGLWSTCSDRDAMLSANALLMSGDTALIRSAESTQDAEN